MAIVSRLLSDRDPAVSTLPRPARERVKIVGEQARVLATVTTSEGTEESVELFAEVVDPPREDEPADEASDPDVEAAGHPETATEDGEAVEGEPVEVDGGEPR